MRGTDHQTGHLCGYVNPEAMVRPDHPLRAIRPLVNAALEHLSPAFDQIHSPIGRPSIRFAAQARPSNGSGLCCYRRSSRYARSGS